MKVKRSTLIALKRFVITVTGLLLLAILFYCYFKTPFFTITRYDIRGISAEEQQSLQERLRAVSMVKYHGVIEADKIVSFRGRGLREAILEEFPNTASVSMYPTGLHTLRISLTFHTPLFRTSDIQAITKEGVIYTEVKPLNAIPLLMIASSTTHEQQEAGLPRVYLRSLSPELLLQLSTLIKKVDEVLFPITRITVDEYGDITLVNLYGGGIKLTKTSDFNKVWSNIVSAVDTDPLKSKLQTHKESLEYLDARFANKVFYKFGGPSFTKQGGTGIIESQHATTTSQ